MLLTAEAYGRRVGLRLPASEIDAVRLLLPHWWIDSDVEPERVWDISTLETADSVSSELELWVAEHAVGLIFVHAGVVAFHGRAIVLPGKSMSGKTTLVAELLKAGADYGSDEYAVFDAHGRVHPYPRPLSIRVVGGGRKRVNASEFGGNTLVDPVSVAMIAVLRYDPTREWDTQRISPAIASLRLLENTVSAMSRTREASLVATLASLAPSQQGTRNEAAKAVNHLIPDGQNWPK